MSQMANFPSGFMAGLTVRGMPLLQMQPGNVFWLDNSPTPSGGPSSQPLRTVGGSDSNHGTFVRPFASLNYALSQCQSGNGDIIFVKSGHYEVINGAGTTLNTTNPKASSTAIAMGCSNVAIIGLGVGSQRPTFALNTANTANIPVNAACMSIANCVFTGNFLSIASVFTATGASVTAAIAGNGIMTVSAYGSGTLYVGAALLGTGVVPGTQILAQLTGTVGQVGTYLVSNNTVVASTTITSGPQDFSIESCEFRDASAVLTMLTQFTGYTIANGCDGFRFVNNKILSLASGSVLVSAFQPKAAVNRITMTDNYAISTSAATGAAMITGGSNAVTALDMGRNKIFRPSTQEIGTAMTGTGVCTGLLYDNYAWTLATATGLLITTGTGLGFVNNYCSITGAADKSALINPVAV